MNRRTLPWAVNIAAVVVVLLIAVPQSWMSLRFATEPSAFGAFGATVDFGWHVTFVRSDSPAAIAGMRIGDTVQPLMAPHARYLFYWPGSPKIGESLSLDVTHGSQTRMVTLVATPMQVSRGDAVSTTIACIAFAVTLLVAALLALLRPGIMSWGFFSFAVALSTLSTNVLPPLPGVWPLLYLVVINGVFAPLGIVGIAEFCLRFPADSVEDWRRRAERVLLYSLPVLVFFQSLSVVGQIAAVQPISSAGFLTVWQEAMSVVLAAVGIAGAAALYDKYRRSSEPERQRMKWVVLGLGCTAISLIVAALGFGTAILPDWLASIGTSLVVALPISVAYAVLRHRVIDIRFVASRALVFGVIAVAIGAIVIALDWAFSTRFTNSPLQTAVYAGIALLVGLSLNTARHRIGTAIDSLLFRRWHETQERADAVGASTRKASTRTDLYDPLTSGIAGAFSLASVALFERMPDGGFLRVASFGWPRRLLWHVMPDSDIARTADALRPMGIDAKRWAGRAVPSGVANPSLLIPIVAGRHAAAILLCGAHENGTALDPDEIRYIRSLCFDASPLYGQVSAHKRNTTVAVGELAST